jgi:hypothetical protein
MPSDDAFGRRCHLELYDGTEPAHTLYSDHPFLSIHAGDLLNLGALSWWGADRGTGLLEVTRVEHISLR